MDPNEPPKDPLDLPPVVRVTPEEAARAVPPPPRWGPNPPPPIPPAPKPRLSRLAVASLILSILGLGLCLPSGIAIVLGAMALSAIHASSTLKGRRIAVAGLVIGILAVPLWVSIAWSSFGGTDPASPMKPPAIFKVAAGPPPPEIHDSPEPYRHPLLANVVVEGSSTGARWSGSGIVIDREGPTLRILTNRHVADAPVGIPGTRELRVLLSSGESAEARTVWLAPEGIDLAAIEMVAATASDVPVITLTPARAGVGQEVFAIGNPLEYRWSLTKGVISSVRTVTRGARRLKIYQTQTPISHGNSGGGLYAQEGGALVGVNTWSPDKRLSEGLGFSISVETVLDLLGASNLDWAARLVKAARNP